MDEIASSVAIYGIMICIILKLTEKKVSDVSYWFYRINRWLFFIEPVVYPFELYLK